MATNGERRVLLLTDGLGGGGLERQLTLLATTLPASWRPAVFSLGEGAYAARLREAGVPLTVATRRFRLDPSPWRALRAAFLAHRPDVVHSWGWLTCCAVAPLCRRHRVAHVAGVIRRGCFDSPKVWLPRLAARLGDLTLANSRAGLEAFAVPAARGRVLHNGFAPERLALASPRQGIDGPFHVVMAATMDRRKDFATLIRAARRLRDEDGAALKVTALGAGPELATHREQAADLVADGTVDLPGRVDEVMDYLRDAHVGVLLGTKGWGEGISNSIMEYMAASLPVVCTRAGGNPELVREDETGFLIPAGDEEALVLRLRWLRDHPRKSLSMGAAGRARIEQEFSVPTMAANAVAIYAEARARRGSRPAGA